MSPSLYGDGASDTEGTPETEGDTGGARSSLTGSMIELLTRSPVVNSRRDSYLRSEKAGEIDNDAAKLLW